MERSKYEISERRIVTIKKDDKKIDLEVPFDFEITEEWLDSKFENPEMAKCINWLKRNGFKLGDSGKWNLFSNDDKHYIKLPQYFIDEFYSKLRVSFGIVEANSFYFPRPTKGYCSMEEFPDHLPKNCSIDMNNSWHNYKRISWVDYTSLDVLKKHVKDNCKDDLNETYFYECWKRFFVYKELVSKNNGVFKPPGVSITGNIPPETSDEQKERILAARGRSVQTFFKQEKAILELDEKFLNIENSFKGINKFQL